VVDVEIVRNPTTMRNWEMGKASRASVTDAIRFPACFDFVRPDLLKRCLPADEFYFCIPVVEVLSWVFRIGGRFDLKLHAASLRLLQLSISSYFFPACYRLIAVLTLKYFP